MATSPPAPASAVQSPRFLSRRQQLLEAGAKIVEEAALQGRLPGFTVDDLLKRIEDHPTRGAFTNCWASKEDYERDLVALLLDARRFGFVSDLADQLMPLVESGVSLAELIRAASQIHFENFRDSSYWHLNLLLTNLIRHKDYGSYVRRTLIENYGGAGKQWEDLFRWLLVAYRRRMRPGLTIVDLVVTLAAIIEGFAFHWLVEPEAVREDIVTGESDGEPWSLVAVTIEGIVLRFTEPLKDGDQAG